MAASEGLAGRRGAGPGRAHRRLLPFLVLQGLWMHAASLSQIGFSLGVKGYRVGQIGPAEMGPAARVIHSCFFKNVHHAHEQPANIGTALRARIGRRRGLQMDEDCSLVLGISPEALLRHEVCIVAVAELSIQPRNGRIPGNFRPPAALRTQDKPLVPYICNVAVDERHRRQGLARALMVVCENIARDVWGCDELYLHVDQRNTAAVRLYRDLGYEPLPQWDIPSWKEDSLGLVPNRYHRKLISSNPLYVPLADGADVVAPDSKPLGFVCQD